MAKAVAFADTPPAPGSPEEGELAAVAAAVDGLSATWVQRVRMFASVVRRGERLREYLEHAGDKPPQVGRASSSPS